MTAAAFTRLRVKAMNGLMPVLLEPGLRQFYRQRKKELQTMTNQFSDFRFMVNLEVTASIHDDGIVILHTGNGRFYASNGTGARIWRGVEKQLPLEAIAREISDEFQIADSAAREQVVQFLAELERHTLIQREVES